jgi:hypothetical protein
MDGNICQAFLTKLSRNPPDLGSSRRQGPRFLAAEGRMSGKFIVRSEVYSNFFRNHAGAAETRAPARSAYGGRCDEAQE